MSESPMEKRGPSVLFVCTANICRSPMAEALFRARLKQERADWGRWNIDSAGTWAPDGELPAKNSRQVMAARGLDIGNHRAQTVTSKMLEAFDLILTMEAGQKEALQVEFPSVANRVFMLSEMEQEGVLSPIADPVGRALEAFEETAKKLDDLLEKGMPRILKIVLGK